MTIHILHEATTRKRHSQLLEAYNNALSGDKKMTTEYVKCVIIELEAFSQYLKILRPMNALALGGGYFDELVDLYNHRSDNPFIDELSAGQIAILEAYPKLPFDLGVEFNPEEKGGVAFKLGKTPDGKVYDFSTGKQL